MAVSPEETVFKDIGELASYHEYIIDSKLTKGVITNKELSITHKIPEEIFPELKKRYMIAGWRDVMYYKDDLERPYLKFLI
jgi:hypothetical protein